MTEVENFSCGFHTDTLNFAVQGLPVRSNQEPSEVYSRLIEALERGYPTKPTKSLQSLLEPMVNGNGLSFLDSKHQLLLKPYKPQFDETILGDDEGQRFPAREFFNNLIDEHLEEYSFIKCLMIPECKIGSFIYSDPSKFHFSPEWVVDFFCPVLDLVIEIDGPQHEERTQERKDSARESFLRKHGIRTHRIPTWKIVQNGEDIKGYFSVLRNLCRSSPAIEEARARLKDEIDKSIEACVLAIPRIQRLIAEILTRTKAKPSESFTFEIRADFKAPPGWAAAVKQDFVEQFEIAKSFSNKKSYLPEFDLEIVQEFSDANDRYKIDLSMFSYWNESAKMDGVVTIRNDANNKEYLATRGKPACNRKISRDTAYPQWAPTRQRNIKRSNLEAASETYFGYGELRTGQFEIIRAAMSSPSVLGLLPTGGGKSLCFQLPGHIDYGCTVVICPITALIRDHVLELEAFGYNQRAAYISAEIVGSARDAIFNRFAKGYLKFLFISPEQLQKTHFRSMLKDASIKGYLARIVVDEVHCLSEWGHDFRTSYLNLASTLRKFVPKTQVTCLTATASVKVIEDIQIEFQIHDDDIQYHMDERRDELSFKVISTEEKLNQLEDLLVSRLGEGRLSDDEPFLIFSQLVNSNARFGKLGVTELTHRIRELLPGQSVGMFTGSCPREWDANAEFEAIGHPEDSQKTYDQYKELVQKEFKFNNLAGIVATKAFGMGVNKPNVRLAIHYGMPQSMESLYQEAGRAGRDRQPAECITLFSPEKRVPQQTFHPTSQIEDVSRVQKELSASGGDLGQLLFFLVSSNKRIGQEVEECLGQIRELRSMGREGTFIVGSEEKRGRDEEKVIYRLKQLGYVSDWTVEDFFAGILSVQWHDQSIPQLAESIRETIGKYDAEDRQEELYARRIEEISLNTSDAETQERNLIRALLEWNYDHFVYQRRQSLKNLYDACREYRDPKSFQDRLDAFFRAGTVSDTVDGLVRASPLEAFASVRKLLFGKGGGVRTQAKIQQVVATTSRYLESYQANPGLNLLSGISRLLAGGFEDADGVQRLDDYIGVLLETGIGADEISQIDELITRLPKRVREIAIERFVVVTRHAGLAEALYKSTSSPVARNLLLAKIDEELEAVL